jgi:hypothetical protein
MSYVDRPTSYASRPLMSTIKILDISRKSATMWCFGGLSGLSGVVLPIGRVSVPTASEPVAPGRKDWSVSKAVIDVADRGSS